VHRISSPLRPVRWFKVWWFDRACERAVAANGPFDLVHGFGRPRGRTCTTTAAAASRTSRAGRSTGRSRPGGAAGCRARARISASSRRIERARYTRGNYRRVLAISELVRPADPRRATAPPGDVETLHPGVDLERLRPIQAARERTRAVLGLDRDAPLVAFLGSDYRRKGVDTLIAALVHLSGAHAFVIGGERPTAAPRSSARRARPDSPRGSTGSASSRIRSAGSPPPI
jgi:glycosyltransferase involved in cell wall biosynthesis